jgi:diacylglycerol O-acyltransferase
VPRMSGSDAVWFRMDRPANDVDVVALLSLDGPLDLDDLRRLLEQRLLPIERFRQRAVEVRVGPPRWAVDPAFSLDRHLSRARIEAGKLRELVGEVATARLEPDRPPWRLVLVEEEGGGTALVAKLHHVLGDGFALMAVLRALSDDDGGGDAAGDAWALAAPEERRPTWRRWASAGADGAGLVATVGRLAALPGDPDDPGAVLSGIRRIAWSGPLSHREIRRAARRRSATGNDLLVAAVAGGLRAVLAAAGKRVDRRRRACVPVNLRGAASAPGAEGSLGNQFGLVFVDLPVDLRNPVERFEVVRRSMRAARSRGDAAAVRDALAICGHLPPRLQRSLTGFFARKCSIVVTNVQGPRMPVRIAGRTVSRAAFWVPHPADLGIGVSILGYGGDLRIGVRSDVGVLPEPADLVARIEEEVAALCVAA